MGVRYKLNKKVYQTTVWLVSALFFLLSCLLLGFSIISKYTEKVSSDPNQDRLSQDTTCL